MKDLAPLFRTLFTAILRAVLPALFDEAKKPFRSASEDTRPQPELRARLQDRVRSTWGRTGAAGALALCVLMMASGCGGTKAVFVPPGEPARLRKTIKKAPVWVMGADGRPVAAVMDLPEGWYSLSDPGGEKPAEEKPAAPAANPPYMAAPPDIPAVYATPAPAPISRSLSP